MFIKDNLLRLTSRLRTIWIIPETYSPSKFLFNDFENFVRVLIDTNQHPVAFALALSNHGRHGSTSPNGTAQP